MSDRQWQEEQWDAQWTDELMRLDRTLETARPDLNVLEQFVVQEQEKRKKALIRDLVYFILLAVVVVSVGIVSLLNIPIVYIVLQCLMMVMIPFAIGLKQRAREKRR